MLAKDRTVRVLSQNNFQELQTLRFPEGGRAVYAHPNGVDFVQVGPDFVDQFRMVGEELVKVWRFKVSFCNLLAFNMNGDIMVC